MGCFKTIRSRQFYALMGILNNSLCCRHPRLTYHARQASKGSSENSITQYLVAKIKANGPITVAEYMKTVLTGSDAGYYMHRDVFGSKGDFITSPEISQMFGEMIGVWCVNEWSNLYQGQPLQVVELGPGRGTLAEDLLRVFRQFPDLRDLVSLHLVEVSPALSQMQSERLTGKSETPPMTTNGGPVQHNSEMSQNFSENSRSLGAYRQGVTKYGAKVSWYRALEDVPKGLSFFLAHEFLDALPVHKFQKTERGWCEVLVDINDSSDGKSPFHFVLSPGRTAASTAFLQVPETDPRDHVEVCPAAGQIAQEVAVRIQQNGGFGLLIDYGHSGQKGDTFRAFKQHKLHEPLEQPGSADLTADVDFDYLQRCVQTVYPSVKTFGPITQQEFLINMGIGVRLQMLLQKSSQEHWKNLITGYDMLTNPSKMGERFKFFSLLNPPSATYVPAGFHTPEFLQRQSEI